jgi:hypothetical protein
MVPGSLLPSRVVTTFAGGSEAGTDNGEQFKAYNIRAITRDPVNNVLYLAATSHNRIRRMALNNGAESSVLAGLRDLTPGFQDGQGYYASFNQPADVYFSNNLVYVADTGNHAIRTVTPNGDVTTLAGNGTAGYVDGPASNAKFNAPQSLTVGSDGAVYVADTGNNCIRKIFNGVVSTYESNYDSPTKICLGANRKLYVTDSAGVKVLLYTPHTQTECQLYTEAGNYQFNVPSNASNVKVVCVGGGYQAGLARYERTYDKHHYILSIDGNGGNTVWTDDFKDVAGETLDIRVGLNSFFGVGDFDISFCKLGNRIITTKKGDSTIPVGFNAGEAKAVIDHLNVYKIYDNSALKEFQGFFLRLDLYMIARGAIQHADRGSYGGNARIIGSLLGMAGRAIEPPVLAPLYDFLNPDVHIIIKSKNDNEDPPEGTTYLKTYPGAVYIEYTINTPF